MCARKFKLMLMGAEWWVQLVQTWEQGPHGCGKKLLFLRLNKFFRLNKQEKHETAGYLQHPLQSKSP
jgi:hypothetical protein